MRKPLLVAVLVSFVTSLGGCFFESRHGCRDHESWDGSYCRTDRGYEHYWDHPDHRDWHPDHGHDHDHDHDHDRH